MTTPAPTTIKDAAAAALAAHKAAQDAAEVEARKARRQAARDALAAFLGVTLPNTDLKWTDVEGGAVVVTDLAGTSLMYRDDRTFWHVERVDGQWTPIQPHETPLRGVLELARRLA